LAPLLELIDRLNNWAAGAVILDTPQTRAYFVERLGLRPDKAHVAYVGAETDLFYPRPRPEQTDGPVRVLFYGTFIPLQGIDIIIKAAAEVQREIPTIRFQIVGGGQTSAENRALAGRLGVRNITFGPTLVPYEQLPALIAGADICLGIFADRPKTARVIPNKLYQCAAMGIPVITADTPAVQAGFGTGELALVPPGDHRALAAAVLALASDPQRRQLIGVAGARAVQARYSPRAVATQVLEACQSII
jgi:glycosyltransferase involved in cell wall biosynthesis